MRPGHERDPSFTFIFIVTVTCQLFHLTFSVSVTLRRTSSARCSVESRVLFSGHGAGVGGGRGANPGMFQERLGGSPPQAPISKTPGLGEVGEADSSFEVHLHPRLFFSF